MAKAPFLVRLFITSVTWACPVLKYPEQEGIRPPLTRIWVNFSRVNFFWVKFFWVAFFWCTFFWAIFFHVLCVFLMNLVARLNRAPFFGGTHIIVTAHVLIGLNRRAQTLITSISITHAHDRSPFFSTTPYCYGCLSQ